MITYYVQISESHEDSFLKILQSLQDAEIVKTVELSENQAIQGKQLIDKKRLKFIEGFKRAGEDPEMKQIAEGDI